MNIAIYTLTSSLHDETTVDRVTQEFLGSLGIEYELKGSDYTDYGTHALHLIYVRTGGSEGQFKTLLPQLQRQSTRPFYLLTSGKSNSLAASMEILSYLNQQGLKGEILHGTSEYIHQRIQLLQNVESARHFLNGCRLGIIGKPSDWLISSHTDAQKVKDTLGIELVDIPMQELQDAIAQAPLPQVQEQSERADIQASLPGAHQIYLALKTLITKHNLQGFTLRCFDLLTTVQNTGCMALAQLNAEGIIASCEGDVPAMLSMTLAQAVTGKTGFQANPASIDPETGRMLFAHCTIPFNMVDYYELDTHFESGIGVGIRGYMAHGPITIFKVSGDLGHSFIAEGQLIENHSEPDLCRTQQVIQLNEPHQTNYFLTHPIGNHHIILQGHQQQLLKELLK